MKKYIYTIIVILIIFFFLPIIPYYDCSRALPPENPAYDWVEKSCDKNNGSVFRWAITQLHKKL